MSDYDVCSMRKSATGKRQIHLVKGFIGFLPPEVSLAGVAASNDPTTS